MIGFKFLYSNHNFRIVYGIFNNENFFQKFMFSKHDNLQKQSIRKKPLYGTRKIPKYNAWELPLHTECAK